MEADGSQHAEQVDCSSQVDCSPILDEVEDFFSLLNSTLCLPESEAPVPPMSQEVVPPHQASLGTGVDVPLPSGRLAERIRALRLYVCSLFVSIVHECVFRECVSGLGVSLVHHVMELLGRADPEEAEVHM